MSGIFGLFNRDARAVTVETLRDMQESMSYWEPDTAGTWIGSSVGLGHTMLWNTPESRLEQLPRSRNQLAITIDARLDNRKELAQQLGISQEALSRVTDSEFVLAAFQKWGEDCPAQLLGDFAFAIWDGANQRLFCARDQIGVKQFYYYQTEDIFIFSNDIRGLVNNPTIPKRLSDEAVANYLFNHLLNSETLTFFSDIKKLPPACHLSISATNESKKQYWRLEDAPKTRSRSRSPEEYAKKFRGLLEQAVSDRLRTDYPVSAHLSGGLDSSAVSVIAARVLQDRDRELLVFNWLYPPSAEDDLEHYEWSNSKTIAARENIRHQYVHLSAESLCEYMKDQSIFFGESAVFWYEFPIREAVQASNSRTILSGWGGDEIATYHGRAYHAELFCRGRFIKLFRELKAKALGQQENVLKRLLRTFYYHVVLAVIPRRLYSFMPRNLNFDFEAPYLVKEKFKPKIIAQKNLQSGLTMQPQRTIRSDMLAYWNNGHIQSRIESWAAAGIPSKIEYCYPLLDRRILEYVIGLPADCFVCGSIRRYLARMAFRDLIPEDILNFDVKEEPKRLEKLLSLTDSVWKTLISDENLDSDKSCFLNVDEMYVAIYESNLSLETKDLLVNQRLSTNMALLVSEQSEDAQIFRREPASLS